MSVDSTQELFRLADAAAELRVHMRNDHLQKPLTSIRNVCEQVVRAWSGSNIGYHACVYFAGLQPSPPEAQFSPEWGLMDRWPTHQPHPGWELMDHQAVLDRIAERSGRPDMNAIASELASIRQKFLNLQDDAASMLTVLLSDANDSFLESKLTRIKALMAPDPEVIEQQFLPSGRYWSRDSLALSQGLRIAPHQTAVAVPLSATNLETSIDAFEKAAREAASHLQRIQGRRKKSSVGTNVFVGHGRSLLWRELKDFLEDRLHLPVDEFNSVPVAGIATSIRLLELLDAATFALLVLTGEDEQLDGKVRARENVVHEVGLFQGRLGFSRAIVLLEEGCEEFSNIHGLGQVRFPKGNIASKFEDIRAVLEREGIVESQ